MRRAGYSGVRPVHSGMQPRRDGANIFYVNGSECDQKTQDPQSISKLKTNSILILYTYMHTHRHRHTLAHTCTHTLTLTHTPTYILKHTHKQPPHTHIEARNILESHYCYASM